VRQLAAALTRRACSPPPRPKPGVARHGQQAGLSKSGSKLPHSKTGYQLLYGVPSRERAFEPLCTSTIPSAVCCAFLFPVACSLFPTYSLKADE
jgi:hypothetical protein